LARRAHGEAVKSRIYAGIALLALMALAACSSRPQGPKRYSLAGKVIAVDVGGSRLTVDHKDIPGFMKAMIMPFPVKDTAALKTLAPGDEITADVVVQEPNYWLENITVTKKSSGTKAQASEFHAPRPGEAVPEFALTNQNGRRIGLRRYRGKALLVTFIYTRCPFPDYCPRISGLFAELDRKMMASPELAKRTHLLSVSIDPAHDKPAVLRNYGAEYAKGTGDRGFSHWEFAAPSTAELTKMAHFFGLTYELDSGQIIHSLSTTLIGPDGRVFRWYHGGDWKPDEVLRDVSQALQPAG
jgi:protein SCO1